MPIYEYKCKKCKHVQEVLQGYDEPPPKCDRCDSNQLSRLISRTSFALKGNGWYKDHYGLQKPKTESKDAG